MLDVNQEQIDPMHLGFTYNVKMTEHIDEQKNPVVMVESVLAANEEQAIVMMKERVFEACFNADEISVLSAERVNVWS